MLASDILHLSIRRAYVGLGRAYIYVLCSKHENVLYVGQTNDPGGVCTRLAAHLGNGGTFRVRLWESQGIGVDEISDLEVFAFALPVAQEFTSRDEVYREGVEYRVQSRLHTVSGRWQPYFRLISNIVAPRTTDYPEVVALADDIFNTLGTLYHS